MKQEHLNVNYHQKDERKTIDANSFDVVVNYDVNVIYRDIYFL